MAKRQDSPDKPRRHSWIPILLLVIGLAVPAGGLWFLTATNRPPDVAGAATSTPVPQPSATATPIPATASPIPTVTIDPTPVVPTATPTTAPAAAPPGEAIEIAIVHSNDTWGYVLPCG
jgi:hypothetical protein